MSSTRAGCASTGLSWSIRRLLQTEDDSPIAGPSASRSRTYLSWCFFGSALHRIGCTGGTTEIRSEVTSLHLHASKYKLIPKRFAVPFVRQRQSHFGFTAPVPVGGVVLVVQHVVTWRVIVVVPRIPVR